MKLRVGVVLWLLSWIPYGLILDAIFGLPRWLYICSWIFEIGLGLLGIWLAGTEFSKAVKRSGWKHAPHIALEGLIHGKSLDQ